MTDNSEILRELIEQDFPLKGSGRYLKPDGEPSSLVLDMDHGIFYWNSMPGRDGRPLAGDAYTWLVQVKKMTHEYARRVLKSFTRFGQTYSYTIADGKETVVLPKLVEVFWHNGKLEGNRDYWYHRGFTDQTIDRFQLGWYDGWSTLPIFMDGAFRNFQIRRDIPEKRIKNWYSGVGPLLFNSDILKVSSEVVITEGPTSAIRLVQEGIPCLSHTGGANGWKKEWNKYFSNQTTIWYIGDNDSAGLIGAKQVAKNLGEYRTLIVDWREFDEYLPKGYDAGDFFFQHNRQDFQHLLNNCTKRGFEL